MTVPEGWKKISLNSIVEIESNSISQNELAQLQSVSLYSYEAYDQGQTPVTTAGTSILSNKSLVPQDCVLLGKLNPRIPRIWRVLHDGKSKAACSTEFWPIVTDDKKLCLEFLAAHFGSPIVLNDLLISPASSTGSHQRINRKALGTYKVLLPPLPEQKKIAAILSSVDETIQATRETIEQTKKVKQGLMQELLTRGIGHTRFKKTEIGEIPEEWEPTTLASIAELKGGSTPSRVVPEYWGEGYCWATPSDLTAMSAGSAYISGTSSTITELALTGTSVNLLPPKSVLMTSRATLGWTAINTIPMATNQGFCNFLPKPVLAPEFLAYWLQWRRPILEKLGAGSTFLEISKKSLRSLAIHLPPLAEQKRIVQVLSSLDFCIKASNSRLQDLEHLKKGLMQDLLTGKVRVAV